MKALLVGLLFLNLSSAWADTGSLPRGDDADVQTTKLVEPKEVPNENLFVRVKDTYRREAKQFVPKTS